MRKEEMLKRIEEEYHLVFKGKLWIDKGGEYKVRVVNCSSKECYVSYLDNIEAITIFKSLTDFYNCLEKTGIASGRIVSRNVIFFLRASYIFIRPEAFEIVCVLR